MNYREAVMSDAEDIHQIANEELLHEDISLNSIQNIIRDRDVYIAENEESLQGYISFDVNQNTLIVTQLGVIHNQSHRDVSIKLLEHPISYAETNELDIRIAVEKDKSIEEILQEINFNKVERREMGNREFNIYRREF